MEKSREDYLKCLVETPSPSGFEEKVQQIFQDRVQKKVDRFYKDLHGNAVGVINPDAPMRVMLAGHCDEIGLMVEYVSDQGYIYFSSIGGIDAHITPGKRVIIHSFHGPVKGIIGKKPIHLLEEKERQKVVKIEDQWIDIGAKNKEEVTKIIQIGDPITVDVGFEKLMGSRVVGRGFDDRVGAFVVAEVLRSVRKDKLQCGVYGVSTVQEELGLRGARTSAFGIDPRLGIAIDVTFASDCPEVDKRKTGEIALGKGPVIARGPNINPHIFRRLLNTAVQKNIPYQIQAESRATGTDANSIQINRQGVATGLLGVPNRYMHTPSEVVDLDDLDATILLITEFLESLRLGENWIP